MLKTVTSLLLAVTWQESRAFKVSTDILNAYTMLEHLLLDDAKLDELLQHGCWCSKWEDGTKNREHMAVVDKLDGLCRDWWKARRCLINECHKDHKDIGHYKVITNHCAANTVQCMRDMCKVDFVAANNIVQYINSSGFTTAKVIENKDFHCKRGAILPGGCANMTIPSNGLPDVPTLDESEATDDCAIVQFNGNKCGEDHSFPTEVDQHGRYHLNPSIHSARIVDIMPHLFDADGFDKTSVIEVYMEHMDDLTQLQEGLFDGLVNLRKIDLSYFHNYPTTLHANVFDVASMYLRVLSMFSMDFESTPAPAMSFNWPELEELHITESKLQEIPTMGEMPKITVINFSVNQIATVNSSDFSGLTNPTLLNKLYLNVNQIYFIDADVLSSFTGLTELYLADNQLPYFQPNTFDGLSALEKLDLSDNPLISLDNLWMSVMDWTALTYLDLENIGCDQPDLLVRAVGEKDADNYIAMGDDKKLYYTCCLDSGEFRDRVGWTEINDDFNGAQCI